MCEPNTFFFCGFQVLWLLLWLDSGGGGGGGGCGCGVPLIRSITVRGYSLYSIYLAHGRVPKRTKKKQH